MNKKIILILVGIFILNSCFSEQKLQGIWISNGQLLEITGNKCKLSTYNKDVINGNLGFFNREINYENRFSQTIKNSYKDSLVIEDTNDLTFFKKIPDSLKSKCKEVVCLTNKTFLAENNSVFDSMKFIENQTVQFIISGKVYGFGYNRINKNGFDVLLLDGSGYPIFIIENYRKNLKIVSFNGKNEIIILKEM